MEIKLTVIVDALAKSSLTLRTAWCEVIRELPQVCCKPTICWNFPVGGTNIMSAFGASVASLILVVIRHQVGELGLVMNLGTFIINGLQPLPLVVNIGLGISSTKHLVEHHEVGNKNGSIDKRIGRMRGHIWWWWM